MILLGEVKELIVNSSGYECCALISFHEICNDYWCYILLNEYVSPLDCISTVSTYTEDVETIEIRCFSMCRLTFDLIACEIKVKKFQISKA